MLNFQKTNCATTISLAPVERVVEFTPNGFDVATVAKILSMSVEGRALNVIANDGYAEVEGRTEFKLTYLDLDGGVQGVTYNADFLVRIEGDVASGDVVTANLSIIEQDVKVANSLGLSAVVTVSAEIVRCGEIEYLADADDCYKITTDTVIPCVSAVKDDVFSIEDEITVGEVGRVLSLTTGSIVRSTKASQDGIEVQLETMAIVTYTEGDEIKTADFRVLTTENAPIDGVTEDDVIYSVVTLKKSRIVLAGVTGENVLRFEADAGVRLVATKLQSVSTVEDMFMLTNEVTLSREQRSFRYNRQGTYTQKIRGDAELPQKDATAVVAIPSAQVYVAKTVKVDDGVQVEGIASFEVIYLASQLDSVRAEVPFSVILNGDFDGEVVGTAIVLDPTARINGGVVELEGSLAIRIDGYCSCVAEYVSAVEIGEEKEVNTSGLSVFIASEGEGMWDACKALTATPEQITAQNPTIITPFADGDRVIYFRSLAV